MGPARIAVLAIALIAAVAAAFVMRAVMSASAPETSIVAEVREETPMASVLTAARDLVVGDRLAPEDLVWAEWPLTAVGPSFIIQDNNSGAIDDYANSVVRTPMSSGEPILPSKVVRTGEAGFMAAVLTPGMRAVAIPISVESGAGGFILPNDRVDVLLTRESMGPDGPGYSSDTILTNVRVLAIDQTIKEEEGDQVVVGSTATLELAPGEAEMVAQANAMGRVSLALRALADSIVNADEQRAAGLKAPPVQASVQVYRYGGVSHVAVQETQERAR